MKNFNIAILLMLFVVHCSYAQQVTAGELVGIHNVDTAEMNGVLLPITGTLVYNTDLKKIMFFDGTNWVDQKHTGITGSIFFADSDGTPTEDNIQLFWNNTDNRLSVGNPLAGANKITANGFIRAWGFNAGDGTKTSPTFRFADDSDTGMFSPAANQLAFTTNDTEALRINATQQVIIHKNLEVIGSYVDSNNESGTTGQVLSSTGTGTDWVDAVPANVKALTTSYIVTAADNGYVITINSGSNETLTFPSGLPIGFNISIYQIGTGDITITGTGTTILNRLSRFKTAGINAGAGIVCTATNTFHLTGDLKR